MDTLLDLIIQPIHQELKTYQSFFNQSTTTSSSLLNAAVQYALQKRGKMMRPILVLLTAKEWGSVTEATYHAAVALELLHTASLVHDDVVDESEERRGQASVNREFDNKVAVLLGDYLLARALYHASQTNCLPVVKVVSELGKELAEGELLQLENISRQKIDEEVYFNIIRKKTATLFAACTSLGAITAGASPQEVEQARLLGENIGIGFQIRDDIFDYNPNAQIGKPTGNDMKEGKLTLPVIKVLNKYHNDEMMILAMNVKNGSATTNDIQTLVDYTLKMGGIEMAEQAIDDIRQHNFELLSQFKNKDIQQALHAYIDYSVQRKK